MRNKLHMLFRKVRRFLSEKDDLSFIHASGLFNESWYLSRKS